MTAQTSVFKGRMKMESGSVTVGVVEAVETFQENLTVAVLHEILAAWHEADREAFEAMHDALDYDNYAPRSAIIRRKYILLDRGTSGVYMVDRSDGTIYGIKGYGQVNKRKPFGNICDLNHLNGPRWVFSKAPNFGNFYDEKSSIYVDGRGINRELKPEIAPKILGLDGARPPAAVEGFETSSGLQQYVDEQKEIDAEDAATKSKPSPEATARLADRVEDAYLQLVGEMVDVAQRLPGSDSRQRLAALRGIGVMDLVSKLRSL